MRPKRRPRRAGQLLSVIPLGCCLLGCSKKLPDEIPYSVSVSANRGKLKERHGGWHLLADGKQIATFDRYKKNSGDVSFIMGAQWTGPKEGLRSVLASEFTVEAPGPCGSTQVFAGKLPAFIQEQSDSEIAEKIEKDGTLELEVRQDESIEESHQVVVDWAGNPGASVKIGDLELQQGQLVQEVPLSKCEASPRVVIDGKDVGELNLAAPIHMLSTRKRTCYLFRPLTYVVEIDDDEVLATGVDPKSFEPGTPEFRPFLTRGEQVVALPTMPKFAFEEASKTNYGGKAIHYQLVASPCRNQ